jgi:formylglycine-generating enzyme required for sulfatase activity
MFAVSLLTIFVVNGFIAGAALAADPFVCCKCKSDAPSKEFCALTPNGTNCSVAADKINNQTDSKFQVTCSELTSGCTKVGSDSSAQCGNEPASFDKFNKDYFAAGKSDVAYTTSVAMTLGVPIPGVSFPSKLEIYNNSIQVPYLAIYITAFQKYLFGISLVAAALMLVYGGLLYILSGTGAKVRDAKGLIQDALIGLGIILGAYVILANINPNTTTFGAIQVPNVKRGTPEDPAEAKRLVEQAATIPMSTGASWVNYVTGQSSTAKKNSGEGGVARDAEGRPVAQGACPAWMIAIKHSGDYKPSGSKNTVDVSSFCIDKYEAPNRGGVKPYNGVLGIEAAWWCEQHGERLCTIDEWQRACLGPEGKNTYGYVGDFDPGLARFNGYSSTKKKAKCNYDSQSTSEVLSLLSKRDKILGAYDRYYPSQADGSVLTPINQNTSLQDQGYNAAYTAAIAFLSGVSLAEKSGTRTSCVTEEGVYDMVGNVAEIVLGRGAEKKNIEDLENYDASFIPTGSDRPYVWMSFYWSPVAHLGVNNSAVGTLPSCLRTFGSGHNLGWRGYENGFRCCLGLNEDATGATEISTPDNSTGDVEIID